MIDREKVIKGLECHMSRKCETDAVKHERCPYWEYDNCEDIVMYDALELLKDQEPIKPAPGMLCGECGCRIYQDANYCYNCGRPVKWDD